MRRLASITFLLLAPSLQAAQPEIRAILLNRAIEGVLDRIWSSSGEACEPADPREDRLRVATIAEADPSAQIELLEAWQLAFPDSPDCETYRLWLSTLAHAKAGQAERAAEAGWGLLDRLPEGPERWFTVAWLSSGIAEPSSGQVTEIRHAGATLLASLGSLEFRVKPSHGLAGSDIRDAVALVGHLAGGLAAYERKDLAMAQSQFRAARRGMPDSAFLAYKIGSSVMTFGDPLARDDVIRLYVYAAERQSDGALPETDRLVLQAFVQNAWARYSGDEPYEDLLEAVRSDAPIDPPKKEVQVDIDYDTDPPPPFPQPYWQTQLAESLVFRDFWTVLRNPEYGDTFWEGLRGKLAPRMELLVVRTEPIDKPQTLFLGAGNKTFVVLKLSEPLAEPLPRGRSVKFEGITESFQGEPFLLTLGEGAVLPR